MVVGQSLCHLYKPFTGKGLEKSYCWKVYENGQLLSACVQGHSVRKLFTGLLRAALIARKATVNKARVMVEIPVMAKTLQ